MKKLLFFVLLALGAFAASASAQQVQALIVTSCGSQSLTAATYGYLTMDTTGKLCDGSSGGGGGSVTQGTVPWVVSGNVGVIGDSGTPTSTAVSVTNASTQIVAASAFANFGKLCVPLTATTGIWVRWDGVAATTAPPAEYIPPGQCDSWVESTGYLPTSA